VHPRQVWQRGIVAGIHGTIKVGVRSNLRYMTNNFGELPNR
jgi:hypothetical protein